MQKIIARGAEALISQDKDRIIKSRIAKGYRLPILDEKLRKLRTRSEAKLLEKASHLIPVPKLISADEKTKTIELDFIKGKKLSDNLESLKFIPICKQIGSSLAKLHDAGLIHGDLTTSNLIYVPKTKSPHKKSDYDNYNKFKNKQLKTIHKGKVYFIDFGLGFHSNKIEDRAVDLHLIREALEARHPKIHEKAYKAILSGYKSSKDYQKTIKQLEKVEKRGRYKQQY